MTRPLWLLNCFVVALLVVTHFVAGPFWYEFHINIFFSFAFFFFQFFNFF